MNMDSKYTTFIIEGIDRIGKDTLINNIIDRFGYHNTVHYSKPKELSAYNFSLEAFQRASFAIGFNFILCQRATPFIVPTVFNRFHLGEAVYSDLYRNYDGNYVFEMEEIFGVEHTEHVKLILLTTSDFSLLSDDNQSFNFGNKEREQKLFLNAFDKSIFQHKQIIDVNSNGKFKDSFKVFEEAIA